MNCAVVIPTYKGAHYIPYLIESLANQTIKQFSVVFVVKPSNDGTENLVETLSKKFDLQLKLLIQKSGNVTSALSLGVKYVTEDIIIFTDDDAILPKNWIERHIKAHFKFRSVGAISGNIFNYDFKSKKVLPLETSMPLVRIYRRFFRPIIDKPHILFRHYKSGVYVTKDYRVVAGPGIPYKLCLSLPCRGVNMSLKTQSLKDVYFPEHPTLKRCLYWEPYVGAQMVMKGWDTLYDPDIYVYHIIRESLSRTKNEKELLIEERTMRCLFKKLLDSYGHTH